MNRRNLTSASVARLVSVSVAFAACLLGCDRSPGAPADAEPPRSDGAIALSPPPPSPRPLADGGALRHHNVNLACRALALHGAPSIALDGGVKPLALNDLADGWVTLAAGETLTVSLPRTGRELSFVGPAVVEPCATPNEAWLLRGTFEGARGSGESPGAEEWVVTPFAVVRYGAAIIDVAVDAKEVRTRLKAGSASILPEAATVWESLSTETERITRGAPLGKVGSIAAADRCSKSSAATKSLDDALAAPDAAASPIFGDIAMRANDARVVGRAACAVAKLRAEAARQVGAR